MKAEGKLPSETQLYSLNVEIVTRYVSLTEHSGTFGPVQDTGEMYSRLGSALTVVGA